MSLNQIEQIDPKGFQGLDNLEFLFLIDNNLTKIESNAFHHLNNLNILNLSRNQIEQIDATVFNGLKNLEQLILSGNKLKKIESNTFQYFSLLKILKNTSVVPW